METNKECHPLMDLVGSTDNFSNNLVLLTKVFQHALSASFEEQIEKDRFEKTAWLSVALCEVLVISHKDQRVVIGDELESILTFGIANVKSYMVDIVVDAFDRYERTGLIRMDEEPATISFQELRRSLIAVIIGFGEC